MSTPPILPNGAAKKSHHKAKPASSPPPKPLPAQFVSLAAFLEWPDPQIRARYETLDLHKALDEHRHIRRIHDLAGKVLQERLRPEEDKCMICSAPIPEGRHGVQIKSWRDHSTGLLHSGVICSVTCVQEYNRQKLGLAELIK
jgi:hypothetical protein